MSSPGYEASVSTAATESPRPLSASLPDTSAGQDMGTMIHHEAESSSPMVVREDLSSCTSVVHEEASSSTVVTREGSPANARGFQAASPFAFIDRAVAASNADTMHDIKDALAVVKSRRTPTDIASTIREGDRLIVAPEVDSDEETDDSTKLS
jgi:hypothetical protein